MGGLQRFEERLERAISGVFARTFRSAVQPVEIAAALQRELDNKAQIISRQRRMVPNAFHVELSASDLERMSGYTGTLADELRDQLKDHADNQGYVFPGPVKIDFQGTEELTTGRFRVLSKAEAAVSGTTNAGHPGQPARAVIEVNGTEHALVPPGLVVGRGSEADIRINDPGVSRRHAQFLITTGTAAGPSGLQIEVHDMGSTNGIRVDGQKVSRAVLRNGSRVQIGHTSMTLQIKEGSAGV